VAGAALACSDEDAAPDPLGVRPQVADVQQEKGICIEICRARACGNDPAVQFGAEVVDRCGRILPCRPERSRGPDVR
jgi:hypothetical protein